VRSSGTQMFSLSINVLGVKFRSWSSYSEELIHTVQANLSPDLDNCRYNTHAQSGMSLVFSVFPCNV
jgi:hypothetical protein